MRYDIILIGFGILCLLGGEGLGMWMASHQDFQLAPAHAHANLVGWVTMSLYGFAHRAYPTLAATRLALPQMVLAVASGITVPFAIAYTILGGSDVPAIVISLLIVLATLMFAIMFFGRAAKAA